MSTLTFQIERYQDAIAEMRELYPEHWEEIALDKGAIPLDPDYEEYDKLAAHGYLHLCTARQEDGRLMGYYLFIIRPHLHYRTSLTAFSDIVFLKREARIGRAGIEFMRFCFDSCFEVRGVQKVYANTKIHHYFGPILKRLLGFKEIEHVFTKVQGA